MSRSILFALGLLCSCTLMSQLSSQPVLHQNFNSEPVLESLFSNSNSGGSTFMSEDFSNGFAGNNPFGAWTVEDSEDNSVWMMATADSPAGQWSSATDPMSSPTSDNGWVIFDAGLYNNQFDWDDFVDLTGFLYSPVMNMSELNSVIVDWHHYFRYCCGDEPPLTLEVSIDGGNEWVVFEDEVSLAVEENFASPNSLYTWLDISCMARNEPWVQLRWAYNSAEMAGYNHYFWGIDDINIYEADYESDLKVNQVLNGDVANFWEYQVTPLEQALLGSDGGLLVGTVFENAGNLDQPEVQITVEILDQSMSVLQTTVSDPFGVLANANTGVCPAVLYDTLYLETEWAPELEGLYYVRSTITTSEDDGDLSNNTLTRSIEYSSDEYGHDHELAIDYQIFPPALSSGFDHDAFGVGCWYHCPLENSMAYGIEVNLGLSSETSAEFQLVLMEDNGDHDANTASVIASSSWVNESSWIGATQYFPFESPVSMDAGVAYFAALYAPEPSDYSVTIGRNQEADTDASTLEYLMIEEDEYEWVEGHSYVPAIRLVLSERAFYGCLDPEACNYDSEAVWPDESCFYALGYYDCNNECWNDEDGDGICDELEFGGCTDSEACNYDANVEIDDGSCFFPGDLCDDGDSQTVADVLQDNCDCEGTIYIPGCTELNACNYNSEATDNDGSCEYPQVLSIFGELVVSDYSESQLYTNPIKGVEFLWASFNGQIIEGEGTSAVTISWGEAGSHEVCVFYTDNDCQPFPACVYIEVIEGDGIVGCTNPEACNYNSEATVDSGSCLFPGSECDDFNPNTILDVFQDNCMCAGEAASDAEGCTSPIACNYDSNAEINDGSCFFVGDSCDDVNEDTVQDVIGIDCNCGGLIAGCTDPSACNYSSLAEVNDGSCETLNEATISGAASVLVGNEETYTYPNLAGNTFNWSVSLGTITAGQGTSSITVLWESAGEGSVSVVEVGMSGCFGPEIFLIVDTSVGVFDLDALNSISVFPNPADEMLFIELPEQLSRSIQVNLIDLVGNTVYSNTIDGSQAIDVSSYAAGMYTLTMFVDGKMTSTKVEIR